ncbi:hypothetical protein BCR35DRAFT_145662 [Leucosporidium creatinivorum]|uniref:Uncharacterized protein n=1 Tax=Leucosporidium creatinivorum TaxID=106004 RepID=A0A1Y2EQN9_9BASI|nr:hypothetical protein BCR35DRAFT_145662 [Leucosporidium creatinivorum]
MLKTLDSLFPASMVTSTSAGEATSRRKRNSPTPSQVPRHRSCEGVSPVVHFPAVEDGRRLAHAFGVVSPPRTRADGLPTLSSCSRTTVSASQVEVQQDRELPAV